MTIAILSHPNCVLHDAGDLHPERPERVTAIQQALENYSFKKPVKFLEAHLATKEQLMAVHDKDYVNWIFSLTPEEGYIGIDADTYMSPHTLNAALRAAGS